MGCHQGWKFSAELALLENSAPMIVVSTPEDPCDL